MTTPPKEIWVRSPAWGLEASAKQWPEGFVQGNRYILAPEHREPKREVVAWVVKGADGRYWNVEDGWVASLSLATRWATRKQGEKHGETFVEKEKSERVVALVRKRGAK